MNEEKRKIYYKLSEVNHYLNMFMHLYTDDFLNLCLRKLADAEAELKELRILVDNERGEQ